MVVEGLHDTGVDDDEVDLLVTVERAGVEDGGRHVGDDPVDEDQRVVHPADKPFSAISGVAGAQGNLAPLGAVVKVAGMADLKFAEPARFDGEEARFRTVKNKKYREGEVLVIRNERPPRGPGMREALATRGAVALLLSKRFSTAICESGTEAIRPGVAAETCHALV